MPKPLSTSLAIFILLFASISEASSQIANNYFKMLPADGELFDEFGISVAISGSAILIGSYLDDDNGDESGSAYLFDRETGQQIMKLVPADSATGDRFGYSVAIDGTLCLIGAHLDDVNGTNSGSAYVFNASTGQQIAKLVPNDGAPSDYFGISVSISNGNALVGAEYDDDNGNQSGSAYLFDATSGQQIAKLLPDDGTTGDRFGQSVAISGTTAIVGAHSDDDNGTSSGSAYLFDITTGQQTYKLLPQDGAATDSFGFAVAVSGTTAVVSAHRNDDNGTQSGSAYLFDTTNGNQLFKLLPNDGEEGDLFGFDVAIFDNTAIVGSDRDDDNGERSGSAYLFDIGTGQQIAKLIPTDGEPGDQFGISVSISNDAAVVGAFLDDDNGGNSGSAYSFNVPQPCPADIFRDGVVNFFDVSAFLTAFIAQDPIADFTDDGTFDFFDVSAFLAEFRAGCP